MQFSLKPVLCSSAGFVWLVLFGVLAEWDRQEIKNCFRTSAIRYRRKWIALVLILVHARIGY